MKLVWSEPALADIESIRDYIRRDSEFYAGRFINRIIEAVESLVELPARGRLVPEADDPDTRSLSEN
jgi:plasmid stabilization system protein ParE